MVFASPDPRIIAANSAIPKKLYANKDFFPVLNNWLLALLNAGLLHEIRKYDGIWAIRMKRGLNSLSLHAFGVAIDVNARDNPLGLTREQAIAKGLTPFSKEFIECSRPYVDCGADWKSRPDGMHFQLKAIPKP